jgi:23S rRNA (guanine745-N1)-methyltransferase
LLRCPVCRLDLAPSAARLVCGNRHSFDVARDGYVNLLDGRRRSLIAGGDSVKQLGHRAASSKPATSALSLRRSRRT